MAAWEEGDLARARAQFEKAIRKTSGNEKKSAALNQLGLVLWELNENEAAAEAFSKSSNLTENLTGANLNMGVALYHAGRYDEAEVALNNVLGEEPRDETALALLGMIEMRKRDWAGASKELTKAATINPNDAAAQNALALAELHQGNNSDRAIERLRKIVAARPDYAPAAFNLGTIHDQWKKDPVSALSWYKHYVTKAGPDGAQTPAANRAIARLGGRPSSAETTRSDSPSDPQAAARYLAAAAKLHGQKKYAEAVSQYQRAIEADRTQKNAYYNMALAYYYDGKYAEAAEACDGALRIDPSAADPRYMLSLSYAKLRKWNDAEREAKALAKIDAARGDQMIKYISDARKR
jgi:tetratricopeptide (TPR) repeat protein